MMPVYRDEPIAVVDAYGAGQLFGAALRARGVTGVHVANRLCDWPELSATLNPHDFTECLDHTGDVEALTGRLRELGVRHVIAGTESGAAVADELAQALGTTTANCAVPAARRDKRLMHRILFDVGVPIPWQQHLDRSGRVEWSSGAQPPGPVVIKPPASAGTDSVMVLDDPAEVGAEVAGIVDRTNLYGEPNDGVVVQEYLRGTEYMINTVSADSYHAFIEIWTSEKRTIEGRVVYDRQRLLDPGESNAGRIREYVGSVLDALGVRWGPSHTEVIMTDAGPLLLETATRLPGGADPALTLRAIGTSQAGEVIDALLAPDLIPERGRLRQRRRSALGVSLISPASGRLQRPVDLSGLTGLESFHGIRAHLEPGGHIERTVDLLTKPGGLYLCHSSAEQLEADYERVRGWETTELLDAIEGVRMHG